MNQFMFGIYPYIALAVFFLGSLVRFDREQYTWRSGSSQLLRKRQLRWGSNLFHAGVLFLLFGHFFGMLTPHWAYARFMGAGDKQLLAMISGGFAGFLAIIGLTILLQRRLADPRIRATSSSMDIALLLIFWVQLALGLATVPLSGQHLDGSMMLVLAQWAQRIVTFQPGAADLIANVPGLFKLHLVLGLTLFLIFPFGRLVHIWSGLASVAYLTRPYQLVRQRGRRASAGSA
jgi:nitrate reductase gamma subunit